MTIAELVKKAHEASRSKGWYDGKDAVRNVPEMLALIHSEVSEALEDYRNGYMQATTAASGKPEGFPSEMADITIRIGDLCGYLNLDLVREFGGNIELSMLVRPCQRGPVTEHLAHIHKRISDAMIEPDRANALAGTLVLVGELCGNAGIDLDRAVIEKMAYNATRPYRHGGKAA